MTNLYDMTMRTLELSLKMMAKLSSRHTSSKLISLAHGQQRLLSTLQSDMEAYPHSIPTVWVHAASLGEFAVVRPLIARLKKDKPCRIIVTFFSPTGVHALQKYHPGIDHVYYLPIDTHRNACRFLDAVKPDMAVFTISEMWCNYLDELKKRNIPTFLVSALIKNDSSIMKWYGGYFRKRLSAYHMIFVLDCASEARLHSMGCHHVSVAGDPLFDHADWVAHQPWQDTIIDHFARQGQIFIAGGISDKKDLLLVSQLANRHQDIRFIFVPHEISEEKLNEIKYELRGYSKLYSECDADTDFTSVQVLIIDFLGALPYLYRYARWAYVGGGFTPLLHSVTEATVYGIPVAIGPNIRRKTTPLQLQKLGIESSVKNFSDLDRWFRSLKNNEQELERIKLTAARYVHKNLGATDRIIQIMEASL